MKKYKNKFNTSRKPQSCECPHCHKRFSSRTKMETHARSTGLDNCFNRVNSVQDSDKKLRIK